MELESTGTEQIILQAAEKLFVEKGYTGTRTMEIAKAAGVNHAMLHYYFRTKENLFKRVFDQKVTQMVEASIQAFDSDRPFFEKLQAVIERHFDYIAQDPGLPFFILRELIQSKELTAVVRAKMAQSAFGVMEKIEASVREEVNRGAIRPVLPVDLLLNIVALNVFSFVSMQILFDLGDASSPVCRQFLEQRRINNVETIVRSIRV
jgi:AcrR family transcriptional regulator